MFLYQIYSFLYECDPVTVASVSHPLLRRDAASHAGETGKLSQIQPTVSWRNNLRSLKNVKESKQQQQQQTLFV